MKRIVVGFALLALLVGLVTAAQGATARDQQVAAQMATEYLQELLQQIKFAQEVDMEQLLSELRPIVIPEGLIEVGSYYSLYYKDDPAYASVGHAYHTMGWYSETLTCGALYPLVYGVRYRPCNLTQDYSASSPYGIGSIGWKVQIPNAFGAVGFWLNMPYGPTGSNINVGGHYFTNPSRNWDGQPHAFIWYFQLPFPVVLLVTCDGSPTPTTMTVHEVYVITWEDWCGGGDHDWNDFLMALFH